MNEGHERIGMEWLTSEPARAGDGGAFRPETDDFGYKVRQQPPITALRAAEIATELSEFTFMGEDDEAAVWVWPPGRSSEAREYLVRGVQSWTFSARERTE